MTFSLRSPFGILLTFLSVLAFVYLLLPIAVIIISPLGETGFLKFPPQGTTLKWYKEALSDTGFINGFLVSLKIAVIAALISAAIGVMAAYALSRYEFPGRKFLEALFLSPLILPTLVLAIALSVYFSRNGVGASSLRLALSHVIVCTPYVIRIALPVLRRFDRTLEEAALNLGATPLTAFFLVLIPVIRPGVIAGAVMAFITSFDEVVLALFLANPGEQTLPIMIYSAVQLGFEPPVAAISGVLVILTGFFMFIYQFFSTAKPD